MESTGKFLRPAQGDAVTAIDLVGGDSQPFCDDPAQPVGGKEAGGKVIFEPTQIPVGRLAVVNDSFGNALVLLDLSA